VYTPDKVDLRWEPVLGNAAASGDLAYTVGRAVFIGKEADGKQSTDYVKYLTVWRRQVDGTWRYVTDGGNSNPGPQGP
jgi:ketosteroid isomerase-like protein